MGQDLQKTSFREQALDELEKYRVERDIGIRGFFLGKKLTETPPKEVKIDENSGCLIKQFADDLFDIISVYTDSNGTIVCINAAKQFDQWSTAKRFYNNLKETVSEKYPTTPSEPGKYAPRENFLSIHLMGTNNEEDWVESYITSLNVEQMFNKPIRSYCHYMMIHKYLYTLNLVMFEFDDSPRVHLNYKTKQYHYMSGAVKRKTRNEMDRALD